MWTLWNLNKANHKSTKSNNKATQTDSIFGRIYPLPSTETKRWLLLILSKLWADFEVFIVSPPCLRMITASNRFDQQQSYNLIPEIMYEVWHHSSIWIRWRWIICRCTRRRIQLKGDNRYILLSVKLRLHVWWWRKIKNFTSFNVSLWSQWIGRQRIREVVCYSIRFKCASKRNYRRKLQFADRKMEEVKEVTPVGSFQKAASYVKKTKLSEVEFVLFGNFYFFFFCHNSSVIACY